MRNSTFVKDKDGNYTHVVETKDQVRRTFTADTSITGIIFNDGKGSLERIDMHEPDGSTKEFWKRDKK